MYPNVYFSVAVFLLLTPNPETYAKVIKCWKKIAYELNKACKI